MKLNSVIRLFKEKNIFKFNFLTSLLAATVLFAFIYNLWLKNKLFYLFIQSNDQSDIIYYTPIFNYLNYPIFFALIVLLLVVLFRKKINNPIEFVLQKKKLVYWILLFLVSVQLLSVYLIQNEPFADSIFYLEHSKRLLETGSYINQYGNLTAFWPVGYPLYLAVLQYLFGNSLMIIKIFNILISTGWILSLYLFFRSRLEIRQLNLLLIISSLYPNFLFNSNIMMPDYLSCLLLWISVFVLYSSKKSLVHFLIAGIILGASTLIRPTHLLLPLIFILIIYLITNFKKRFVHFTLFLAGFLIVISPWLFRNYALFKSFPVVATNGGFNFLMGNHPGSSGKVNFDFNYNIKNPNEADEQNKAYLSGLKSIIENPISAFVRSFKKVFFSYYRGDSSITWLFKGNTNYNNPVLTSSLFFLSNYYHYLIIYFSMIGFIKFLKLCFQKELLFILFTLFIYYLLIILVFVGNERYLISILPIHFLAAVANFNK